MSVLGHLISGFFVAALAAATGTSAYGLGPHEWVLAEWEKTAVERDFGDSCLSWEIRKVFLPSNEEIKQLRTAVAGKPDHPDRLQLTMYERRLAGKPDVIRRRLWMRGSQWRMSGDITVVSLTDGSDIQTYCDTVVADSEHWQLTAWDLLVEPSDVQANSPVSGLINIKSQFRTELSWILDGGFGVARHAGAILGPITVFGDRWTVVLTTNEGKKGQEFAIEIAGTWDSQRNQGSVSEAKIVKNDYKPEVVGERWLMKTWDFTSESGFAWCPQITNYRPDGRISSVIQASSFSKVTGLPFALVLVRPSSDGIDFVRGPVTFITFHDLRVGIKNDVKTGVESALAILPIRQSASKGIPYLTYLGWVSMCRLLVGFALVAKRRMAQK